jgi:putative transposase
VLKEAQEKLERIYRLEAESYDFKWLVNRVARRLGLRPQEVLAAGKYPQTVKARSLLCYWATRELRVTTMDLPKKLKVSQPTVSRSARRGVKVAHDLGLYLNERVGQ